ncbi:MAG: aldehyde dehydrogenase family protein [Dehalobacterium sp.]
MQKYRIIINGEWRETGKWIQVYDKYKLEPFAIVAAADAQIVNEAVVAAKAAYKEKPLSPYQRYEIFMKGAQILKRRQKEIGEMISKEVGKTIKDALGEVSRAINNFILAAEESKRIVGEIVPIDAIQGNESRFCYTIRQPKGVIGCIAPFNFPFNLVAHKVCPAIAAGNSVVLKPASTTPISSVLICEVLEEAGLPAGYINLVTGSGSEIGEALLANEDISFYSFTGSAQVGRYIASKTGLRQCSLELGSNSGVIVCADALLEATAEKCLRMAMANAGQVCISVQRILVEEKIKEQFISLMVEKAKGLKIGEPLDPNTDLGPMISEHDAIRAETWVKEAVQQGAVVRYGGKRLHGAVFEPTIIDLINHDMKVWCEEVFAPIVCVDSFSSFNEALMKINNSKYGLQAGIFTTNINQAMKASKIIETGGVIINDVPTFRADNGPYGGVKESGVGREGMKYAIEEMTHLKVIVWNLG